MGEEVTGIKNPPRGSCQGHLVSANGTCRPTLSPIDKPVAIPTPAASSAGTVISFPNQKGRRRTSFPNQRKGKGRMMEEDDDEDEEEKEDNEEEEDEYDEDEEDYDEYDEDE